MGRELRRVPLDFDWPLHKVWDGFINHHYIDCAACGGNGATVASRQLDLVVDLLMLAGGDSVVTKRDGARRFHPYFAATPLAGATPDAALAEVTTGLSGREMCMFGHDSIDRYVARKKILAAAGLPETWGDCPACHGDGRDPSCCEAVDAWIATEPPEGDGYQVWETVSEGSPISPVFATSEQMVAWLVGEGYTPESAERFITTRWAPSLLAVGGAVFNDINALGQIEPES